MRNGLTRDEYERLRVFLREKGARSRVQLFLIAAGMSVPELVRMTVPELRALAFPMDLAAMLDDFLHERKSGLAFQDSKGKPLPHTTYYRLVREAFEKVTKRPNVKIDQFRAYIKKGN